MNVLQPRQDIALEVYAREPLFQLPELVSLLTSSLSQLVQWSSPRNRVQADSRLGA
jgi:hypothetical protein